MSTELDLVTELAAVKAQLKEQTKQMAGEHDEDHDEPGYAATGGTDAQAIHGESRKRALEKVRRRTSSS